MLRRLQQRKIEHAMRGERAEPAAGDLRDDEQG
jgi:hypothetical protein